MAMKKISILGRSKASNHTTFKFFTNKDSTHTTGKERDRITRLISSTEISSYCTIMQRRLLSYEQANNQAPPNPKLKAIHLIFCNSFDMQIQDHQNFNHNSTLHHANSSSHFAFQFDNFFGMVRKSKIIAPRNNFSQKNTKKKTQNKRRSKH